MLAPTLALLTAPRGGAKQLAGKPEGCQPPRSLCSLPPKGEPSSGRETRPRLLWID